MPDEEIMDGIVYVLTNPEMPGLVKIGETSRDGMKERLSELYKTGVPVPFRCEYAARVSERKALEKAFHAAFEPHRVNPNREFFRIEPEQAIAILKVFPHDDVTPSIQKEAIDIEDDTIARATIVKRSRRPNMNFEDMGIPVGAELKFINSDETVTVVDSKRVNHNDTDYFLTAITHNLLGRDESENPARPAPYWTHEGKSLDEIYDETYGLQDS